MSLEKEKLNLKREDNVIFLNSKNHRLYLKERAWYRFRLRIANKIDKIFRKLLRCDKGAPFDLDR